MLSENVYNAAVDYTMPTGVDVSVLDGVFTEDTIREDVKSYVMNAFDDNSYEVDTSKIYASLKENVDAFLREQGIDPTTEDKAVDEYVKAICNIYKDRVKLPGLNYLTLYATMAGFYKGTYVFRIRCSKTNKDRGTFYSEYSPWLKVEVK